MVEKLTIEEIKKNAIINNWVHLGSVQNAIT